MPPLLFFTATTLSPPRTYPDPTSAFQGQCLSAPQVELGGQQVPESFSHTLQSGLLSPSSSVVSLSLPDDEFDAVGEYETVAGDVRFPAIRGIPSSFAGQYDTYTSIVPLLGATVWYIVVV